MTFTLRLFKNNEECNFVIREVHSENDQAIAIVYIMVIAVYATK